MTKKYFLNPVEFPSDGDINIDQAKFNNLAKSVVLKVNRNYSVYPIDPLMQLTELTRYVNQFAETLLP